MSDWDIVPTSNPWEVVPSSPSIKSSLTPGTASQSSGFVPTKEDLMNFLPGKNDILPMAGMVVGGMARKASPLVVGTLTAGGEAFNQLGQRYVPALGLGSPPATSADAAKRIGEKFVQGAAGETFNKYALNPAMSAVGKLIIPGADAATQSAVKTAEEEGIKALPSMVSKSKAVAGVERGLEYSPLGATISKARQQAVDAFGNFAQRVGEGIAPNKPPEVNGALVKESAQGFYDNFNEVKNKLYNSVMPQIADKPVDVTGTVKTLNDIVATAENRGEKGIASYARGILDKVQNLSDLPTTETTPGMASQAPQLPTFSKVKDIATGVGQRAKFFDPTNPGMQGQLKQLWGSFQEALDKSIEQHGDESIKQGLNQAKEYYASGKTILKDKIFKAITSAPQGMEYKIAFNSNNPMAYDTVKEVVGAEQIGGLARQWFDGIVKDSTKDGLTSPQLILNKLENNSAIVAKLSEDFPEAAQQIDRLKQVASLMTRNKDVMKGSVTAPLGSMYGTLAEIGASVAAMFTHPLAGAAGVGLGAATLGGSKLGAEAVTSDAARNFLTKGYPAIQKGVETAVGAVARPAEYLGINGMGSYLDRIRQGNR